MKTQAQKLHQTMHARLIAFSKRQGSPRKAAGILKTKGLSFDWIQKYANGVKTNPTVNILDKLERQLDKAEALD